MQIIGLCRFSYPAEGGFQVDHPNAAARAAYLYAPDRMEERFRLFEALCLPSLRAQEDQDFTFLIVIGKDLPAPWRERLHGLVEDMPQAIIKAYPPGPHRKVMQHAINSHRRGNGQAPCLQFRHDDDDALHVSFTARLRDAARGCRRFLKDQRIAAFDFNRGYVGKASALGLDISPALTPYWGVALGVYAGRGTAQSIMNFAHMKLPQFMPTITQTDQEMFIRGHNGFNDSRQKNAITQVDFHRPNAAEESALEAGFGLQFKQIREIFGATPARAKA